MLFLNLTGAALLSIRLFAGRATFHRLAHRQTTYLPIFGPWAAIVVTLLDARDQGAG